MRVCLLAVGRLKAPFALTGCEEFASRITKTWPIDLREVADAVRRGGKDAANFKAQEGDALHAALAQGSGPVVVLDDGQWMREQDGQLQEMQNTLGTLTQVSQSVGNIQNEFNTLFPDQASWDNYDFSNFGGKLDEWSTEIDNATIEAMTAQGIVQRAALNVTNVNSLLAQSQTADGEVRQLQLLNQSMGILAQQMNDSLQLLAANGRLEAAQAAQQEKSREAARARKTKMLQNLGKAEYDTAPLSHLP